MSTVKTKGKGLASKSPLLYWSETLGIEPPKTCRIRRSQVLNLYKRPYKLCGYCEADDTIYYHGKLDELSIIHELLHKRFRNLAEKDVRTLTKILKGLDDTN